jgi:hypothetical protein
MREICDWLFNISNYSPCLEAVSFTNQRTRHAVGTTDATNRGTDSFLPYKLRDVDVRVTAGTFRRIPWCTQVNSSYENSSWILFVLSSSLKKTLNEPNNKTSSSYVNVPELVRNPRNISILKQRIKLFVVPHLISSLIFFWYNQVVKENLLIILSWINSI